MGFVNFSDADFGNSNNYGNNIKFFSLKNDGEEAYVRFVANTTDDFNIVQVHEVDSGNYKRKVNCLREAKDPIDKCPFCETGISPVRQKFFVYLVKYTFDQSTGNVAATPMIWERPTSFASDLASKITTYGAPLSNHVFKITRHGVAGYNKTTYSVDYMPPNVCPDDRYVKKFDDFENYSVIGGIVLDKSASDMTAYIREGSFPAKTTPNTIPNGNNNQWVNIPQGVGNAPVNVPVNAPVAPMNVAQAQNAPAPQQNTFAPQQNTFAPQQNAFTPQNFGNNNPFFQPNQPSGLPWENTPNAGVGTPVRTYQ